MKRALISTSLCALTAAMAAQQPAFAQETEEDVIVVTGKRLAVQRALESKRNADAIIDVVSADDIGKLPVKNAAEAIDFLPGVSLEIDQGEGRYVTIRGAASNLNNVTLNGVSIGSPEGSQEAGGGRVAPLDVIGGELLKGIEVVKAVTPDMDHQALGGSVNILTFSPFDFDGRFGFASAAVGYGEYDDRTSYRASGTYGNRLSEDGTWGFLIGASYSQRDFQSVGVYPDDWAPASVAGQTLDTFIPEQWKSNLYDIERERLALNAALEYQPTDEDKYYVRALWSEFNEDESRIRYAQRISDQSGGVNELDSLVDGVGTYSGLRRENELRREKKDKRIFNITAGGTNERDNWLFEYEVAYNDNQQEEPNSDWEFRDTSTSGTFNANSFLVDIMEDPATTLDPDGYRFQRLRFQSYDVDTAGFILSGDATWSADFLPRESYFKAGFNYRTTDKEQDYEEVRYGRDTTCTLGEFGLSGGLLDNDVDGQIYELGPIVDGAAVDAFFSAQPQCFELSQGNTVNDGFLEDFTVDEAVTAGYLMASLELTDKLTFIGGVRVEHTQVDADGFEVDQDLNVTPVSSDGDYTNVLPSIHLRYEFAEDLIARFAWTNTIGRPFLDDISPARSLDFEDDPSTPGQFVGGFSTGNPDLEAFESENFDLSLEYYLPDNLGILSAAFFSKEIDGFIVSESVELAGGTDALPPIDFEGRTYSQLGFSRPINADGGDITGIELGYQQMWDFLPGALGNLGAGLNVTFVDSELEVNGRTVPFVGQSDELVGAQLFYQDEKLEAVLTYNYNSEYLDGVGGDSDLDIFYNDRERLDFKGRYRITPKFDAFLEWQNINDEPDWEYQGQPNRVTGYELYGQTVFFGFNGKL